MHICSEPFEPLARATARSLGMPALAVVTLPHPIAARTVAELQTLVAEARPALLAALAGEGGSPEESQRPAAEAALLESAAQVALLESEDDPEAIYRVLEAAGLTDGLPVVPPTPARVAAMLGGRDPQRSLGPVPPGNVEARLEVMAANAVMAGCLPEHFPVIMAAVRAMLKPEFNLQGLQTTTHLCAPLLIVHGPVARKLGFHSGAGLLGQGFRANAAVGRAVRLILQNVGQAKPGVTDRATFGQPAKFSYCMAEGDSGSWAPLHEARGIAPGQSAVTVVGAEGPHNINDHGSQSAAELLLTIAATMAVPGANNIYLRGEPLLIFGPEHADLLQREGLSRADVQQALFQQARVPVREIGSQNLERYRTQAPHWFDPPPADGMIPLCDRPEDLLMLLAGGPGRHSLFIPSFGATKAVTVPIEEV